MIGTRRLFRRSGGWGRWRRSSGWTVARERVRPARIVGNTRFPKRQAAETARRILLLREQHRHEILAHLTRAAAYGHQVLEHLYEHPIVSVNGVRDLIGTSYRTANTVVSRLVELGILREATGQARNRRFVYQSHIGLFSEQGAGRPTP